MSATSGGGEKTRPRGNDLTFLLLLLVGSEELTEKSQLGLCLLNAPAAHTMTAVCSAEGRADSQVIAVSELALRIRLMKGFLKGGASGRRSKEGNCGF